MRLLVLAALFGLLPFRSGAAQAQDVPRLAVGGQVIPVFGVSARVDVEPRLTVQVAAFPSTLFGLDEKNSYGGRVLVKFLRRPAYSVSVAVGVNLFVSRRLVDLRYDPQQGRYHAERAIRANQLYSLTVSAETFMGRHVSMSGDAGVGFRKDGVGRFEGEEDRMLPILGLGLHYYF